MALSVHERADAILALDLAARMKKLGWRKRARTFWRDAQTVEAKPTKVVQLCEVVVGGSTSSVEGVVRVTLATFFPEHMPVLTPWQKKPPSPIKEVDGHIRTPLGLLLPAKDREHAWRLGEGTQDDAVAKELADTIESVAVPFLDGCLDMAKVVSGDVPGVDPQLAALLLVRLARKDEARAQLEAILAAKPKDYMAVASLAGRLKLPPPPRPAAT